MKIRRWVRWWMASKSHRRDARRLLRKFAGRRWAMQGLMSGQMTCDDILQFVSSAFGTDPFDRGARAVIFEVENVINRLRN